MVLQGEELKVTYSSHPRLEGAHSAAPPPPWANALWEGVGGEN